MKVRLLTSSRKFPLSLFCCPPSRSSDRTLKSEISANPKGTTSVQLDIGRTLFAIQRVVTPKDLRLAAVQQLSGDHQPITCWMPLKAHVEFIGLGAIERSEEHTFELQSHHDLVCRLLL